MVVYGIVLTTRKGCFPWEISPTYENGDWKSWWSDEMKGGWLGNPWDKWRWKKSPYSWANTAIYYILWKYLWSIYIYIYYLIYGINISTLSPQYIYIYTYPIYGINIYIYIYIYIYITNIWWIFCHLWLNQRLSLKIGHSMAPISEPGGQTNGEGVVLLFGACIFPTKWGANWSYHFFGFPIWKPTNQKKLLLQLEHMIEQLIKSNLVVEIVVQHLHSFDVANSTSTEKPWWKSCLVLHQNYEPYWLEHVDGIALGCEIFWVDPPLEILTTSRQHTAWKHCHPPWQVLQNKNINGP